MQRHEDVVQNQIGTPIPGVTITVRIQNATPGSGALATIYSDDGSTVISGSAVTTDTHGRFFFFAPDGKYDLTVTGTGITTYTLADIEIADVTERFSSDTLWTTDSLVAGQVNDIRYVGTPKYPATSAGIQAAIDDSTDGTIIQLPCNDKATDPLLIDSTVAVNKLVVMQGCGQNIGGSVASRAGTHLRQADGSNLASMFTITKNGVVFRDLYIDGNKANNPTAQDNILVLIGRFMAQNITSSSAKRYGLHFDPASGQQGQHKISQCTFAKSDSDGIHFSHGAGAEAVADVWINDTEVVNNLGHQLYADRAGGLRIINSDFSGGASTGTGDGIFLDGTGGAINFAHIVSNQIVLSRGHGIRLININVCVIVANEIINPGQQTANTFDGVNIDGTGRCTITGNYIADTTDFTRDGIRTTNMSQPCIIEGNFISGTTGPAYNLPVSDSLGALAFVATSVGTVAPGTTTYLGVNGAQATEVDTRYTVPWRVTATRLEVAAGDPGGSDTYVYTVVKNGSDETMTCTISSPSTTCSTEVNPVILGRTSGLSVKLVTSATAAAVRHRVFLRLTP